MNFFRSQPMNQYNLIVPRESAWIVMNELADLDCIHFVDYDPTLPMINRPFANYLKRCDELLNKLSLVQSEIKKYKKRVTYCPDVKALIGHFKAVLKNRLQAPHTYIEELESDIDRKSTFLSEQIKNLETLNEKRNSLIEHRAILIKRQQILGENFFQQRTFQSDPGVVFKTYEDQRNVENSVRFNQVVGVIRKEDEVRFKRIVFRVTKGNVWINMVDIDHSLLSGNEQILDVKDNQPVLKSVFVIIYPGAGQGVTQKLARVAENFGAARYEFPDNQTAYGQLLNQIEQQLTETRNLLALTKGQVDNYLDEFVRVQSNASYIEELKLYLIREKYLYTNLNYMQMRGSIFQGTLWMPSASEALVERTLRTLQFQFDQLPSGQLQQSRPDQYQTPPTYFKLNDFTWTFQEIVNTYGIPRYQEINPGLFTCVTFPFLFGVMFADIGHGLCLLLFGLYLVSQNQSIAKSDSMFKVMLPARHMFAMMGFFAFYNGWIYNDFLSISLNVFGSCYQLEQPPQPQPANSTITPTWNKTPDCTYPFGIDPVWSVSSNQLTFVNSYKMKLSVIIGVIHMSCGILLKGVNAVFFKNWLDLIFEFIPQIIFMICTFGFMDFMLIFKWLHSYDPSQAPSIITLLINMALDPFSPSDPPLWGDGTSEQQISFVMLAISLICVPIMLLPKPLILNSQHKSQVQEEQKPLLSRNSEDDLDLDKAQLEEQPHQHKSHGGHEKHDFGEIFVHQVIETIEFVLGSISNTASYLRLWALSLAHGQLAEVFFSMTLSSFVKEGGPKGIFGLLFGYIMFALATFGVLMLMDVMECFLHALRLHWVEFQNKFYKADGYIFVPYSYGNLLKVAAQPPE